MAWGINTHDIAHVYSLDTAAKAWDAASPWRNEHTSWRPLTGRRMRHKRIVKLSEDRGYQCVLYNTAVVTYMGDGTVLLRCHDSRSTQSFASCVKPAGCNPVSSQGRMFWKVETPQGTHYYREEAEPLVLAPAGIGKWELLSTPAKTVENVNDVSKRAAVRKMVKPYATWYATVERLTGPPHNSRWQRVGAQHALEVIPLLSNHEHYLRIAQDVADPAKLTEALYLATGASYKAPVPTDRLPRNLA